MSTTTPNIGLFKYDTTADANAAFNINTALNNNWDLIDEAIQGGGGTSRNIGEVVASTVPLTDAGLHLLDGAIINGSGVYSDFVEYMADLYAKNPTANYFAQSETIRTFNYTKAGTESFRINEDNGILSGFTSTTAFATAPAKTPTSSMDFVIKVKQDTLTVNQSPIEVVTNLHGILLRVVNASTGQINAWIGGGSSWICDYVNTGLYLTAGTWTYIKITWDGSTYNFYQSLDGETWTTGTPQTNKTTAPDLSSGICLGGTSWDGYPWANGQIDLNGCYLKCDNITVWQGYTDTDYTADQMWQRHISKYGVCGKFVYNSTNNTVRLPKYSNKIFTGEGTVPVIGNGLALGITNGTLNTGLVYNPNSSIAADYMTVAYGTNAGTSITTAGGYPARTQSIGVTTDPSKSGLVADLSGITSSLDGYYYIVVATSTKTDIQVDIDEIATDLNDKVNKSDLTTIQCVTDSGIIGNSWYRIWSDGWCEQGGITAPYSTATDVTISLLYPYRSHNYSVSFALYTTDAGNESGVIRSITKNSFNFYAWGSRVVYWRTAGYMEV